MCGIALVVAADRTGIGVSLETETGAEVAGGTSG